MRIAVIGQTHLGIITAACLAARGHRVWTWGTGTCGPEPGLAQRVAKAGSRLRRAGSVEDALDDAEVIWFTEDTPVDAHDRGDADGLVSRVVEVLAHADPWQIVIVSSQIPIGTTERIIAESGHQHVAYVPENLKKGKGVERFECADRYVAGIARDDDASLMTVRALLTPFTVGGVYVMPLRAAEATKHVINSYLAVCITLANEIGQICAAHGIDPKDVEVGLRTDARVGDGPPVTPGGPIRGGTLLRDVWYLEAMADRCGLDLPLIRSIHPSNDRQLTREAQPA